MKKKNAQDATLRNIRAMKKRAHRLEQWVAQLTLDMMATFERLDKLERKKK